MSKSAPNQTYIYLHKVDGDANNNKFYEMKNMGDGTFISTYGREGAEKPQKKSYPMSDWDSVYSEKTGSRKGYTDVTQFKSEQKVIPNPSATNSKSQVISADPKVVSLITALQKHANVATAASYKVEAKQVTQAQIDEAQKQVDLLANSVKKYFGTPQWDTDKFNKALTYLMIIIPRKMKHVADHLVSKTITRNELDKLIDNEQALLDSMAGQVIQNTATDATTTTSSIAAQQTLLEQLGLEIRPATPAEFAEAKANARDHGHKIANVFKVVNKTTQQVFNNDLAKSANKKTMTLWHGSRRQNWFFIINQGLKIRPSGAIHTGSMFGDGIYFASEDDKSMGYTEGGRWTYGSSKGSESVFMALYDVRVGKQYETHHSDSSLCFSKVQRNGNCDSTWGKKGPSLHRHEYIIYRSEQSTIKYLVEFK